MQGSYVIHETEVYKNQVYIYIYIYIHYPEVNPLKLSVHQKVKVIVEEKKENN